MSEKITLTNKLTGPVEEAYRTLRTNIQFCSANEALKTICITSCNPNEGKTTVSTNLAISLASASKKVLMIDADMRKPRYFKDLPVSISRGLSNYLSGMADLDDIICETNFENLDMILCGAKPPNPAELIGSQAFARFLEEVSARYEIVIIDTPPLGSVIDAAIIASRTDGTIFVIQSNSTDRKKAQRVKEQLVKANARIIGAVMNKVPKREFRDYYTYYNYYHKQERRKSRESREDREIMQIVETMQSIEKIESMEGLESIESLDRIEDLEDLKSIEIIEGTDRIESVEGIERIEGLEGIESRGTEVSS